MKQFGIALGKSVLKLLIAVAVGFALILLVYLIPTERIEQNVLHSAEMYQFEQVGFNIQGPQYAFSEVDNYTDGLMLLTAMDDSGDSLIERAMMNYRVGYHNEAPNGTLVKMAAGNPDGLEELQLQYPRYWHGYLIWMKPLLLVFDAQDLRVLGMLSQFVLVFWLLYLLQKELGTAYSVAFLVTWIMMNPLALASSFQFYSIFYLMLLSCIYMLKFWRRMDAKKQWPYFYLMIGVCVGYFDLFTYPIASLGVPLALGLLLRIKSGKTDKLVCSLGRFVEYCFFWVLGYAGMWAGKWILNQALTGFPAIQDALAEVLYRTADVSPSSADSLQAGDVSLMDGNSFDAIIENVKVLCKWPMLIFFVCLFIGIILYAKKEDLRFHLDAKRLVLFGITALLPILWYAVVRQHSLIHSRYTYRGLAVTIFTVLSFLALSFSKEKKQDIQQAVQ